MSVSSGGRGGQKWYQRLILSGAAVVGRGGRIFSNMKVHLHLLATVHACLVCLLLSQAMR